MTRHPGARLEVPSPEVPRDVVATGGPRRSGEIFGPSAPIVAVVSTYVPRQCGIATFSRDLLAGLRRANGVTVSDRTFVVALTKPGEDGHPPEVRFRLPVDDPGAYRRVADALDAVGTQVVSLQHEYGIYGGEHGERVLDFLDALRLPVVSTLHTVRSEPTPPQRQILRRILERSARVVVMAHRAREILLADYGIDPTRVAVVPHGVPEIPFGDPDEVKRELGLTGRRLILTFGLLSPNKGLELVIRALPRVRQEVPNVLYVNVGATHPEVRRRFGEAYRDELLRQVAELGLGGTVQFVDRFVDQDELIRWLRAADVFVTPYGNAEQIVSGTLSYALAAGCAVVSTPYAYAVEVLDGGRGVLVPFGDPEAMGDALARLLADDELRAGYRERAYAHGRTMVWPAVGARYWELFREVARGNRGWRPHVVGVPLGLDRRWPREETARFLPPVVARRDAREADGEGAIWAPGIDRRHLDRLSDERGIFQHAGGSWPDPRHGYCTDDVARALVVDLLHAEAGSVGLDEAIQRGIRFLDEAFDPATGRFRNFRSADGRWLEAVGSEDSHGRAVRALGEAMARASDPLVRGTARRLFGAALHAGRTLRHLRPQAHVVLGCEAVLAAVDHPAARRTMAELGERLAGACRKADPDWPWPEPIVTYDNGLLPEALLRAGARLERPDWIDLGIRLLDWLLAAQIDPRGHLTPVGNRGWWPRGGRPARFDQQPIEALSLLEAARAALEVTGDRRWLAEVERAFAWFLGANDGGVPLVDWATGGCHDGLGPNGVNLNEGAESTLAWLLAAERLRRLSRETLVAGQPLGEATLRGGRRADAAAVPDRFGDTPRPR